MRQSSTIEFADDHGLSPDNRDSGGSHDDDSDGVQSSRHKVTGASLVSSVKKGRRPPQSSMEHGQSSLGLGWSEVSRETRRYVQFEKASRDSRDARREGADRTQHESFPCRACTLDRFRLTRSVGIRPGKERGLRPSDGLLSLEVEDRGST